MLNKSESTGVPLGSLRKFKIGVMGSAREPENSLSGQQAFAIGKQTARHGGILLTGGCPGLPHSAVLGAMENGGMTIAVSPAMNRMNHLNDFGYPVDSETMIFTGMGNKGRNVVLVRSCDACVFVSGGMGTLNEFTIAFDDFCENNVIGILESSGGFSDNYIELARASGKKTRATILSNPDPIYLVDSVIEHLVKLNLNNGPC